MKLFITTLFVALAAISGASADPIALGPCPGYRGLQYLYAPSPTCGYWLERDSLGVVQLTQWDAVKLGPLPEASAVAVAAAHMVAVDAMRAQLRTAYAALTVGVQIFYRDTFAAAQVQFIAGNVVAGRDVIATTPAVTDEIGAAKTAMLALVDAAFPPD